jgi:hypothetical protein
MPPTQPIKNMADELPILSELELRSLQIDLELRDVWDLTDQVPKRWKRCHLEFMAGALRVAYDRGVAAGKDDGFRDGYAEGQSTGFNDGHDKGFARGFDAGLEEALLRAAAAAASGATRTSEA